MPFRSKQDKPLKNFLKPKYANFEEGMRARADAADDARGCSRNETEADALRHKRVERSPDPGEREQDSPSDIPEALEGISGG